MMIVIQISGWERTKMIVLTGIDFQLRIRIPRNNKCFQTLRGILCFLIFCKMIYLSSGLYSVSIWLLNVVKWIEFRILKLFTPVVESMVKSTFRKADIEINGSRSWDVQVHRKDYFPRIASYASLAAGEAYMEGWCDCENLAEMFYKVFRSGIYKEFLHPGNKLISYFNLQTKIRAWEVGQQHYDAGNDLFEAMLDSSMNYSCGYWRNATTLDEAQIDKMDLIARKLMLKPGMRVLDIGCGWGALAKYLAENYNVHVVGCTISEEQAKLCRERCKNLDVEIRLVDYRDIHDKFDRIVSVGMFEHVGHANYPSYFQVANRCLVKDGIFLLHTIGVNHNDVPLTDPWFHKYIFPNGILPFQKHITEYVDGLFIIEDWHNFGHDYSRTLEAWLANFKKAWPQLEPFYGKTFYRMWIYYLSLSIGAFRSRRFNLWQIVLTKEGLEGGYIAPR